MFGHLNIMIATTVTIFFSLKNENYKDFSKKF